MNRRERLWGWVFNSVEWVEPVMDCLVLAIALPIALVFRVAGAVVRGVRGVLPK